MAAMQTPSARLEAEQILRLTGGNPLAAYDLVERQMNVLVMRTQVILSLAGIVITVTGFSGRAIADTNRLARGSIAAGIIVVLLSAVVAIGGVLTLRWMTQRLDGDPLAMLTRVIALRERKARFMGLSLLLFVGGFSLYCLAIAQLLLAANPR